MNKKATKIIALILVIALLITALIIPATMLFGDDNSTTNPYSFGFVELENRIEVDMLG